MSALPAMLANAWLVGLPLAVLLAAGLPLLHRLPGRARYLIALAGVAAVIVAPVLVTSEAPPHVVAARMPALVADAATLDPTVITVAVWLIGSLLLVARELAAHARLARSRRTWTLAPARLREELAVAPRRPLYLAAVGSPHTQGLLRPVIVLPRGLVERLDGAVVRRIVAHEEAHARWRDPLVLALLRLLRALLWISPALWIAERLVAREREAAADEAALRGAEEAACLHYAEALLAVCRGDARQGALLAVGLSATAHLEHRVRRIVRPARRRVVEAMAAFLVVVAAALGLAFTPRVSAPGAVTFRSEPAAERAASTTPLAAAPSVAVAPTATAAMDRALVERSSSVAEPSMVAVAMHLPLVEMPPPIPVEDADLGTVAVLPLPAAAQLSPSVLQEADVHRDVHVARDEAAVDEAIHRDVRRIRIVRRGDGGDDAAMREDFTGRSKHPAALFHRAVTSPLKRWWRSRSQPLPEEPSHPIQ